MFSSNSLDKSCIGPDCSSGRNNASNRFPVGMTSLGDENQHIRIQLAVHKYNSSASSPLNSRCGVISPFRHSFLNNSVKPKCYEEVEGTSKSDKRNGNLYEGVGAFPTIHLKKSAVRYRPIRRFKDVKVSYPELPVNRFLSNLPETCPDAKSSTRSVLDVLEDLSGKKIHSKDENGTIKPKTKGLGGDYVLNQNVVYKPLFVQKPKISSVLTRDNTTQTLSTLNTETPSPQCSNSVIGNDASDPRAELRRKLAKQNNEIFASLSSSISPSESFSLKRKIDKVTPSGHDESLINGSGTKNPRIDQHANVYNGSDISKSLSKFNSHASDPFKISRKSQLKETNSPNSPNKDRLTTIFLDMQNTSRKAQILQNKATLSEAKPAEVTPESQKHLSNGFTHTTNAFSNNISSSSVKSCSGTSKLESDKDKRGVDFAKTNGTDNKPEIAQVSKPAFNFPVSQVNTTLNNITTTATFQFGVNAATSDLGTSKTLPSSNSNSDDAPGKMEKESNMDKKTEENPVTSKPFVFGMLNQNEKTNFTSFKFGADESTSSVSVSPKDPKTQTSDATATSTTNMPIPTPQFPFGTASNSNTSASQPLPIQFGVTSSESTLTATSKPLFSFGQNTPSTTLVPPLTSDTAKTEEKVTAPNSSNSTAMTIPSLQSNMFKFGEKSTVDKVTTTVAGQTVGIEASPGRSTDTTFPPSSTSLSTNTGNAMNAVKTSFPFGQNIEIPSTCTSGTTNQEPKFTFSFGQKPDMDQNNAQGGPKSSGLFPFGQKPVPQESPNTSVATDLVSSTQPATTQTSLFGQNVSQTTSSTQMKFGQVSAPQAANNFGTKSEGGTLGGPTSSALNQGSSFPMKTSLFGSPASGFGTSTTQTSSTLGSSTSNAPTFNFGGSATTQSTPAFGVSSTSQTAPTFGVVSTAPSGFCSSSPSKTASTFGAASNAQPGFGTSSTTVATSVFGISVSAPAFGVSSAIQSTSTFPTSSTTQSGSSFGAPSTTQSLPAFRASVSQSSPSFGITSTTQSTTTFGVSSAPQSSPCFGASSTTQSAPAFGASTPFVIPTSSQANTAFGTSTPTQSVVRFGASVPQNSVGFGAAGFGPASSASTTFGSPSATSTSAFGPSQTSFSQPFNNKPTTSLRPTTAIFGQSSTPSFPSGSTFNANQNNVFVQKPNSEGEMFDQNKIQTSGFGTTSQTFGNQGKFTFGMSTSSATGFTTSPPNTTSSPVFSFGGSATSNTFTFGSGSGGSAGAGSSMSSNTQTPFAFKSPSNEPFKFGTATSKEGPAFGSSSATFTFGQMNHSNAMTEQKPAFSFGGPQASSSSAPFTFGTTPSPSVFSFGGSASGSSGSTFNFGTPTPGGPFGQTPSASPAPPFPVPGTFSIGSGSSQSRPRATSRPRRRP